MEWGVRFIEFEPHLQSVSQGFVVLGGDERQRTLDRFNRFAKLTRLGIGRRQGFQQLRRFTSGKLAACCASSTALFPSCSDASGQVASTQVRFFVIG